MEPPNLAKGPAGQYFADLVKACEDHFSRVYPECVNSADHGTIMCPPAFPFGYIAPTGQASGAAPLADIEKASINGDTAELKLFHMLEKFGKETKQPMFVLTQLKISEFIKNILHQKLPADHPILGKALDGEIDFLIIHRQIGIVLIEVKATKKFSKSVQGKAQKQLQTGEEIIYALLQADHKQEISIPVYKVIAMPNVCEPSRGGQNFVSLREMNLQSDDEFISWWKTKFAEKEFGCQEKRQLQSLISIFVGQKCEVRSRMLSDIRKKIENQSFLRKSYEKITKQTADGSQIVEKTAEHLQQAILTQQFLFLNPDQLRIWNGPLHLFFNGSSGSGKTILLQFKALECAKRGEKVVTVVPSSLNSLYKDFFSQNNISSELVDVLSPWEFFQGSNPGSDAAKFHFFADELQTFQTEIPDILMLLEKLLITISKSDCYCWIAYDYMQRSENEISQDATGGLASGAKLQAQARALCETYNFHHAPCLKTVVRSTFEIYSFVQAFVKNYLHDLLQRLILSDHIGKETKETWVKFVERYEVSNHLGHHICGPSVAVYNNSDFDLITRIIHNEVKKWTEGESLHHVAVLVTTSFLKERLSQLMTMKEIPVCDVGNQMNAVVLDFGYKAYSYEWPVVISVSCPNDFSFSSNYVMFTRAVSRLVVITSCN